MQTILYQEDKDGNLKIVCKAHAQAAKANGLKIYTDKCDPPPKCELC